MELTTKQYNQVSTTIKKYLFKRGIFLSKWDFEDNILIPSVKIETKKIKNKENMQEDNLSNIEK